MIFEEVGYLKVSYFSRFFKNIDYAVISRFKLSEANHSHWWNFYKNSESLNMLLKFVWEVNYQDFLILLDSGFEKMISSCEVKFHDIGFISGNFADSSLSILIKLKPVNGVFWELFEFYQVNFKESAASSLFLELMTFQLFLFSH